MTRKAAWTTLRDMRPKSPRKFIRLAALLGGLLSLGLLGACGMRLEAADIAEAFYEGQRPQGDSWSAGLFVDKAAEQKAKDLITRRELEFGSLVSIKKIASNKRISLEGQGRTATATFIFEITCEKGRTREILTITQNGRREPFRIIEYVVENMRTEQEALPSGTSST